jgi:carbamoyl-phosphate synthase large subunit
MQKEQPIRLFVRQSFTESGNTEKLIVQQVLNLLQSLNGNPYYLEITTGLAAQSQDTFRCNFESTTGLKFTPQNFRIVRLKLLEQADAMIIVRTGLSESGAFEIAYNVFAGKKVPMFFAVWQPSPIKTTMLRDLEDLCTVKYVIFENPNELKKPLSDFIDLVDSQKLIKV